MSGHLILGGDVSRHDRQAAAFDALRGPNPCTRRDVTGYPCLGGLHRGGVACPCPQGDVWRAIRSLSLVSNPARERLAA